MKWTTSRSNHCKNFYRVSLPIGCNATYCNEFIAREDCYQTSTPRSSHRAYDLRMRTCSLVPRPKTTVIGLGARPVHPARDRNTKLWPPTSAHRDRATFLVPSLCDATGLEVTFNDCMCKRSLEEWLVQRICVDNLQFRVLCSCPILLLFNRL